jgi:OmpA-OmpF porin, OOP family
VRLITRWASERAPRIIAAMNWRRAERSSRPLPATLTAPRAYPAPGAAERVPRSRRCSSNSAAKVALCARSSRYRTLARWLWRLALVPLLWSSLASAEPTSTGFALDRYQPAAPGSDWFQSESLDLRGKARPGVSLVADFSYRPLVLRDAAGAELSPILRYQFFYHASASVVLAERLRLSLSLPFLLYSLGGQGTLAQVAGVPDVEVSSPDGTGVGDVRFALDLRVAGAYGSPFTLAVGARVFAATGQEKFFASDGLPRVAGRLMAAGQAGLFAYASELGIVGHVERDDFVAVPFGADLTFGAALGLRLLDGVIHLGPELHGATVVSDSGDGLFKRATTPLELEFGAKFSLGQGVRLGAAADAGLTSGLGSPKLRCLVALDWLLPASRAAADLPPPARDLDGDGVVDELDACPEVAGPSRPLQAARSGCPDPVDSDGDRISDELDACPRQAGPASADPQRHGCPPPPDTDGDGIADSVDACPNVAGIIQPDPSQQGCPLDADRDGIVDSLDACPNVAGEAYPNPQRRGCPRAEFARGAIQINEPVQFAAGSSQLVRESDALLEAVVQVLVQQAGIDHVVVEGHTDSSGSPRTNLELSRERAAAVVKWLVAHGISSRRLNSRGFGSTMPIDSNDTQEGRARNRRVEFRVLGPHDEPVVAPSR